MDAFVSDELDALRSDMRLYVIYAIAIQVVEILVVYLGLPAVAYVLFVNEHATLATWVGVGGLLVAVLHLLGAPYRCRAVGRGRAVLRQLQDLRTILGRRTVSKRELQQALDQAAAAGVVSDRCLSALVEHVSG